MARRIRDTRNTSYGYTVKISVIIDGEATELLDEYIGVIILNYDYDKNNMPIIYIGIRLESDLYNDLTLNADSARFIFTLSKYDMNATSIINEPVIHDSFIYIMSSDPNYRQSLESITESDNSTSYLEGYIGLIKLESLNDNKKLINTIYKNCNAISMVHTLTNHMKMVIEPFDNNDIIDQFIIPPITSLTNVIEFINEHHPFYKSGYRLFRDFNKTYLLSNNGVAVPDEEELGYNTVIINIVDPVESLSATTSIEINDKSKSYIINVDATATSLTVDRATDKLYNSIIGINSNGDTKKLVLDIPTASDSTEKVLLQRICDKNFDYLYNIKNKIESMSVVLTISKADVDSSILTPNKEYLVRNYRENNQYDGRYVLSYKKEVYVKQSDYSGYEVSTIFSLRKVSD